ncbi:hypothetical protein DFJ73DRAFT_812726 [Zopfochytrium polystomum]|nr:hypothetical protein DFJ73DRAFT_812726 [Zopfochytrium polystomum]
MAVVVLVGTGTVGGVVGSCGCSGQAWPCTLHSAGSHKRRAGLRPRGTAALVLAVAARGTASRWLSAMDMTWMMATNRKQVQNALWDLAGQWTEGSSPVGLARSGPSQWRESRCGGVGPSSTGQGC